MSSIIKLLEVYQGLIDTSYMRKSEVDLLEAAARSRPAGELDHNSSLSAMAQAHLAVKTISFEEVLNPQFAPSVALRLQNIDQLDELCELENMYLLARNSCDDVDLSRHASLIIPRKDFPKFEFRFQRNYGQPIDAGAPLRPEVLSQAATEVNALFESIPLLGFVYLTTLTNIYIPKLGGEDTK